MKERKVKLTVNVKVEEQGKNTYDPKTSISCCERSVEFTADLSKCKYYIKEEIADVRNVVLDNLQTAIDKEKESEVEE